LQTVEANKTLRKSENVGVNFFSIIKNMLKLVKKNKKSIFSKIAKANIFFFWTHLKDLVITFLAMFYLSTYLQWLTSYRRKNAEQADISASAVPKGFKDSS